MHLSAYQPSPLQLLKKEQAGQLGVALPYRLWDSEELLKAHLQSLPSTSSQRPIDWSASCMRAQEWKQLVHVLERRKLSIAPQEDSELEKDLAVLRFSLKVLSWALFPINHLPVEILNLIFRFVIQDSVRPQTYNYHRMLLTWVCHHWREVALNNKILWSSIWFQDLPPYECSLTFLERAGDAPLDIRIGDRERHPYDVQDPTKLTTEQATLVLDAMMKKLRTLRSFVGVIYRWDVAILVVRKFHEAGVVPVSLEHFELHRTGVLHEGWQPHEIQNPFRLINEVAPRLTSLTIDGLVPDLTRLPMTNLTSLDLRRTNLFIGPSVVQFKHMIQGSPNLYKLSLVAAGPHQDGNGGSHDPIRINSLRELVIGDFIDVDYALFLVSLIDAPNVMSLDLHNLFGGDCTPLLRLLTRRFLKIRLLSLYMIRIEEVEGRRTLAIIIKFFQHMPELELLKIGHVPVLFLFALSADPRDLGQPNPEDDNAMAERDGIYTIPNADLSHFPVVCPKLRYLHFQSVDSTLIKTLLSERSSAGLRFSKVYTPVIHSIPLPSDLIEIETLADHLFILQVYGYRVPEEMTILEEISSHLPTSVRPLVCRDTPGFTPIWGL
ncbi:unnamed protein product [Somion occarium]|uniref:F-box domain-containing protein n=1 Tax=Somion occarium TaxID=3059160 RepID=A0ABP1CK61_9APHY